MDGRGVGATGAMTTSAGAFGSTAGADAKAPLLEESQGPLGFLDRLLDSERDSNLYFGDVRFWQHLEHIDINNLYRLSSLEYRTVKMMFFEAVFYALYLFFLTGFITSLRSGDLYESRRQQMDYWAGCHRAEVGRTCTVDSVKDIGSLMEWLRNDFVPKAFTFKDTYPSIVDSPSIFRLQDKTMHWMPRYIGDTKTAVLLGAIRLRQLRVIYNKDCVMFGEEVQSECFPAFETGLQSKLPWAPAWTPDYLRMHYEWHRANKTEQPPMVGFQAEYPGDGFYFDLPMNLTAAKQLLTELEEWQWLDMRSRALIVEFNALNPNVNIFVHSRLLFEFPATGGLLMRHEAFPFRALQLSLPLMATDEGGTVFAWFILTTAMHWSAIWYVVYLMRKNGLRYFTYFWSWADMIIIILFLVYFGIMLDTFTAAAREPTLQPEVIGDMEVFFPIGHLVPKLEASNGVLAWLGLMAWLKILKYFSLVGSFHPFVRVVERCIWNLLRFIQLMVIVLFGFAVALYIGYGDETNIFSTIRGAFVAVMVAPAGGVDLGPIFEDGTFLGPALMIMYMIVVFLLLLNTFMAICVDTYSVCTFQISECTTASPTAVFLWTFWNALKGIKLVGKETVEEIGEPDEQHIQLTSLPEVVQDRYTKTKQKMLQLLNSANAEMKANTRAQLLAEGQLTDEQRPRSGGNALALEDGSASRSGKGSKTATLALAESSAPRPPSAPLESVPPAPTEEPPVILVKRVQLQRMMEDDPGLCEILGNHRAVDVIRRFRVDQSGVDPYAAIAALQSSVARKLEELKDNNMELSFDEFETLKQVSTELHSALTEAQKEWRQELLTVMQMTSLLSASLIELTQKLEAIQLNQNSLRARVGSR